MNLRSFPKDTQKSFFLLFKVKNHFFLGETHSQMTLHLSIITLIVVKQSLYFQKQPQSLEILTRSYISE